MLFSHIIHCLVKLKLFLFKLIRKETDRLYLKLTKNSELKGKKLELREKTQKLKEKTQGFGKSIWSSCRKQVQFLSLFYTGFIGYHGE